MEWRKQGKKSMWNRWRGSKLRIKRSKERKEVREMREEKRNDTIIKNGRRNE